MSALPPVADPTASISIPTAVATSVAPTPTVSTLAPSTVTTTAPSARPPILAAPQVARPATVIGTQASSTTTTSTTKSSSKSKKKSGSNSASVTMATATTASTGGSGGGSNGENTGRWTAEEHNLFLQGLELHGKGWKKIAGLIKSRTVVQIRTHAQKYFQKLAKAKQNGEDVTMAGGSGSNGGAVAGTTMTMMMGDGGRSALNGGGTGVNGAGSALSSASASGAGHATAHASKRRKQTSGTKRKAIQSVVASARRQGNKKVAVTSTARKTSTHYEQPTTATGAGMNSVAPALASYVLPTPLSAMISQQPPPTSVGNAESTAQGDIDAAALEDSLFRFLTPTPVTQVNPVARQAGANPITLPSNQPGATNTLDGGEVSPTGVNELELYPAWTDYSKDIPSWYQKGCDVDGLLEVADSLDWFTDTGDFDETYAEVERLNSLATDPVPQTQVYQVVETQPPKVTTPAAVGSFYASTNNTATTSMNTLPRIESVSEVPPLPPLFVGVADSGEDPAGSKNKIFQMSSVPSATHLDEDLLEDHEYAILLDDTGVGSSVSLSVMGAAP